MPHARVVVILILHHYHVCCVREALIPFTLQLLMRAFAVFVLLVKLLALERACANLFLLLIQHSCLLKSLHKPRPMPQHLNQQLLQPLLRVFVESILMKKPILASVVLKILTTASLEALPLPVVYPAQLEVSQIPTLARAHFTQQATRFQPLVLFLSQTLLLLPFNPHQSLPLAILP